jgi:hypothetical protein
MCTLPPVDFTALATRLVIACAEQDVHTIAKVLEHLDPEPVDVFGYVHTPAAHLSPVGSYRGLYLPDDPYGVQQEPTISQVAAILEEVAKN